MHTYRTTGNVTFRTPAPEDPATTASRIENHLTRRLGHPVGVFLRTGRQMRAIADATPFPPEAIAASRGVLQVLLLARRPSPAQREQVLALQTEDDLLAFGDMELYWLPVAGDAQPARWSRPRRATVDFIHVEKVLGPATMRGKSTVVDRMAAKYFPGERR